MERFLLLINREVLILSFSDNDNVSGFRKSYGTVGDFLSWTNTKRFNDIALRRAIASSKESATSLAKMVDRNLLLLAACDESDSEVEEVLALSLLVNKRNKKHRCKGLSDFSFDDVAHMARFSVEEIRELRAALQLPEIIRTQLEGYTISGEDGLFLTLRRLSYPCRLRDISREFCMSKSRVGAVFNFVINHLYETWNHLLGLHESRFRVEQLRQYAQLTADAGSPIQRCVGFIDGTCRPICRPSKHQRLLFSGHKRVHALKFQSVVTPDGLISHLSGPYAGHRHDVGILRLSGLLEHMKRTFRDAGGPFSLYGDGGYGTSVHLLSPFKGAHVTADMAELNLEMSRLRISVEWRFGEILRDFAFVDYKKNQKLFLQPVGRYYVVCALLSNCKACLHGNEVTELFHSVPPTLETYLAPK